MNCQKNSHRSARQSRFHVVPKARGGKDYTIVCAACHEDYHRLFNNRMPREVIAYLVDYFWGGDASWVEDYLANKNESPDRKYRSWFPTKA